ncbi:MAG: PDZ domain-containing protein [Gemmatimonadetes bacterium]|nr:PDZ domain-containing protein [Gemmatimonadota bacterium]
MNKLVALSAAFLIAMPALAHAAEPGYLGVRLQSIEGGLAEALDREDGEGVLVSQVEDDSPAAAAGLEKGDIVTKFDGKEVEGPGDLSRAVRKMDAGAKVKVEYIRDGKTRTSEVTLGEMPDREHRMSGDRENRRGFPHRLNVKDLKMSRDRGYLGVMTQPLSEDLAKYFGAKDGGALVSEVMEDSPAAKLGLKAGDVITKVDGKNVEDPSELREVVGDFEEPTDVEIVWVRDKKEQHGKASLEVKEGTELGLPDMPFLHDGPMRWFGDDDDGRRVMIERRIEGDEDLRNEIDQLRDEIDELRQELKNSK